MELGWDDIVIDQRAVGTDPGLLTKEWLWLAPDDAEPILPTACGDLFLRRADGRIAFLDTYAGSCATVAPDYEQWQAMLDDPEQMQEWFRCGLVEGLLEAGLEREPGQCFSPLVPPAVGGSWRPSNFHACDLYVHLAALGQLHRQVKDLPPGTRISGFNVEFE
jgi:T6SS immunity protein Tdi1, C-terminal